MVWLMRVYFSFEETERVMDLNEGRFAQEAKKKGNVIKSWMKTHQGTIVRSWIAALRLP